MPYVLIVDDDRDARDVLTRLFKKVGYLCRSEPNGQAALAAIGEGSPDVVLLDWMMPQMDGTTFLEIVRSYLRWQALPVVLLTAHDGPHIDRARQLGVKCVFRKPHYDREDLLAC